MQTHTIAAVSTPPGRGGIGIVRLSGPSALEFAAAMLRRGDKPFLHASAEFVRIPDILATEVRALDEGLVTAFMAPRSYTGEDLVEIAAHGSPVVLDALLRSALLAGARLAEPGEFTQRAFLGGKLDLTQAEAVHDLIAAQTLEQARAAAQQLGGALSRRVAPIKERLVYLIALLEAGMDFASGELDDVEVVAPETIAETLTSANDDLARLAHSFRAGSLLRSGVSLALVGRPNAGKSSLFNRLLERPRAIVTAVPGTTRDTVEEAWSLHGIPVRLVDTAGLRLAGEDAADEAERQGILRSREALADADVVLLVHDATVALSDEEKQLEASLEGRPYLLVKNKVDLETDENDATRRVDGSPAVRVSALTGQGIDALRDRLLAVLQAGGDVAESGALNNLRQQESVLGAMASLRAAQEANRAGMPHEVLLMDMHSALRALDTLTGATTTDDILGRIFSTFCIGK